MSCLFFFFVRLIAWYNHLTIVTRRKRINVNRTQRTLSVFFFFQIFISGQCWISYSRNDPTRRPVLLHIIY